MTASVGFLEGLVTGATVIATVRSEAVLLTAALLMADSPFSIDDRWVTPGDLSRQHGHRYQGHGDDAQGRKCCLFEP